MSFLSRLLGGGAERVSPSEAWKLVEEGAFLLDVRSPAEFQSGFAPGAKLIPVGELAARIDELPRDKVIVAYCRSGARSGSAVGSLKAAGFQAVNAGGLAQLMSGYEGDR